MKSDGVRAEKLVWIFGTGRSGSTWLASMLGALVVEVRWRQYGLRFWNEPLVGRLVGEFYTQVSPRQLNNKHFIFGDSTREAYLEGIRILVLNVARMKFWEVSEDDYLIIKEPNGSIGAPLLMEALPESRMVFLVRDPRDVAASALDRHRTGGIAHEKRSIDAPRQENAMGPSRADIRPGAFVAAQARRYLKNVGAAKEAFDAHKGFKTMVRYEDLRADTLGIMRRICSELGIPVDDKVLVRAVEENSWENVPEDKKGSGKDRRKATPGGWQEDLTPQQAKNVREITAILAHQFYPDF
jgi:Sulfotransferase family